MDGRRRLSSQTNGIGADIGGYDEDGSRKRREDRPTHVRRTDSIFCLTARIARTTVFETHAPAEPRVCHFSIGNFRQRRFPLIWRRGLGFWSSHPKQRTATTGEGKQKNAGNGGSKKCLLVACKAARIFTASTSLKSVNCRKNLPAIASREHCSSRRGLKFQQSWVPIVPRTAPRLPPAALDRSLHPLHHHIDPRAPHHLMEPKSGEPIPVVRRHPLPLPTTDGEVRRRRSRKTATTSGTPQKVHEANATVVTKICSRHPITILPMKKPMFLLKRRRNAQPRQEYRRASWGFATWGILVI